MLPLAACCLKLGASDAGAKLEQLRSLGSRSFNRSLELPVGLSFGARTRCQQQQFAALPVKLRIAPCLIVCICDSEGFVDKPKPVGSPSGLAMERSPQSQMVRNPKACIGPPELLKRGVVGG